MSIEYIIIGLSVITLVGLAILNGLILRDSLNAFEEMARKPFPPPQPVPAPEPVSLEEFLLSLPTSDSQTLYLRDHVQQEILKKHLKFFKNNQITKYEENVLRKNDGAS